MSIFRWLLVGWLSLGCGMLQAAVAPWVDFTIVNGLVVIPTEVQGIKGFSAIDSGAQYSGIVESFVKKHDLKFSHAKALKIRGVNGSEVRKVYQNVPVRLMGAQTVFKRVVDLNLDPRGQMLIGGDFLRGVYIQFDYPNKRLRAISRDTFNLKKVSNVKSKLDPVSQQPMAKVRLNDEHDMWLVIDTGSTAGVKMKRAVAKKREWLEKYSLQEEVSTQGATTTSRAEIFRMPLIEVGPFNVKNARVTVPLEGQRSDMFSSSRNTIGRKSKVQGLLGYDVLKNFLVTFDYRTGSMFIELPAASEEK